MHSKKKAWRLHPRSESTVLIFTHTLSRQLESEEA